MNLQQFFQSQGYDVSEKLNWDKYLNLWSDWYKGKVRKFHSYYIYNGSVKVKQEKKSLQGAKKVCEDWADLIFNEKVKISLNNEDSSKALNDILFKNNSTVLINQGIERTFELGIGAIVTSVQDMLFDESKNTIDVTNSKIKIEFVDGKKIWPLSWDNTQIKECAFVTYKTIKGVNHVFISMHVLNEQENYVVKNFKFKLQNRNLVEDSEEQNFIKEFDTKSSIPWFTIMKPNVCNNIDEDTPFGISIFANSIDVLMSLDNAYDGLDKEGIIGRRRIFIAEEMMTYDSGREQLTFDPQDIGIYRLPKQFENKSIIEHSAPALRTKEYIEDVNFQLNILSTKSGFGQERYRFDGKAVQTATGVISENSDMYRTLKKHELVTENSLREMVESIAYASTNFGNQQISAEGFKVDFDDSIIEDKSAERMSAQSEVGAGLRSKKDYLMKVRGFGKEEAIKELDEIKKEKVSSVEDTPFPEEE